MLQQVEGEWWAPKLVGDFFGDFFPSFLSFPLYVRVSFFFLVA